jgi:hypothetical protein
MSTHNYYALDMVPKPLMSKIGTTTMLLGTLGKPLILHREMYQGGLVMFRLVLASY